MNLLTILCLLSFVLGCVSYAVICMVIRELKKKAEAKIKMIGTKIKLLK